MLVVKDAMVLIHLAKISLLGESCKYFKDVIAPKLVFDEVMEGVKLGHADAKVVEKLKREGKIRILGINDFALVKRATEFNIQGGEAQAVALYWQEKADILVTDDDNVRKKGILLDIKVIGTLAIVLKLKLAKIIKEEKFRACVSELRRIGWFGDAILDRVLMEGSK